MHFRMKCTFSVALVVAATVFQTGCSFLLVDGPPSAEKTREFHALEECTDSFRAPTVDTIAAVVLPSFGLLKMASLDGGDKVLAVPALLSVALFVPSAIWGYYTVGRCRRYLEPHTARLRSHESASNAAFEGS